MSERHGALEPETQFMAEMGPWNFNPRMVFYRFLIDLFISRAKKDKKNSERHGALGHETRFMAEMASWISRPRIAFLPVFDWFVL